MKTKLERGQYGYLTQRKKNLVITFIATILIAVAVFILGLALNKWETRNIFTVFSIVMVLPATKTLVVLIIVIPFKAMSEENKNRIASLVNDSDTVFYDAVFTSSERHMHLDCIVVCPHQVIGYTSRKKDNTEKISEYFKKEFKARGIDFVCFITDSEKNFENRFKVRSESESISEKQSKDMKDVIDFIKVAIV